MTRTTNAPKTVVYSAQERDFEPGLVYRNPRYFGRPQGSPDIVIVVGDWPNVAEAYRALGVEVREVPVGMPLGARVELAPPPVNDQTEHENDEDNSSGGTEAPSPSSVSVEDSSPPASGPGAGGETPETPTGEDVLTEKELRVKYRNEVGRQAYTGWSRDQLLEKLRAAQTPKVPEAGE